MPRIARPVFAGIPHHITQRGNRRENVFFSDGDRAAYLGWLAHYCEKFQVQVLAYCLMTNHLHLVAVPERQTAFEEALRPLHMRYAQRINRARGWTGHVWQGRYFSSALCGTEDFVRGLELQIGQSLQFNSRGRPKEVADESLT